MSQIWNTLLIQPLLNSLILFYRLTGNLGWSIILLTVGLRLLMTPLILPGLRLGKKMRELGPELADIKLKYKSDKAGLVAAQSELYRRHGINPAAGCLPQLLQLFILIALFSVFNSILKTDASTLSAVLNPNLYSFNHLPEGFQINLDFFYLKLHQPDTFTIPGLPVPLPGLFLLLSAVAQLASSLMMSPALSAEKKIAAKTASDSDDVMVETQKQMTYLFPLMTLIIGYQFPSGLVLYWVVFSVLSAVQQYYTSGWGGLKPWLVRLNLLKSPSHGQSK